MKIEKVKGTYNTYKLEISYGQLEAFQAGLQSSPDPVSDETLAELDWYLNNIPGPGEDPDEFKAREEGTAAEGSQSGNGKPGEMGAEDDDDGVPIPMPPREAGDYRETTAGEGPEEPGGEEDLEPAPRGRGEPPGRPGGEEREGLPRAEDEEEEALPAPPRE